MLKVADLRTPAAKQARIHALSIWCCVVKIMSKDPKKGAVLNGQQATIKAALLRVSDIRSSWRLSVQYSRDGQSLKSDLFMQRAQAARSIRAFTWGSWGRLLSNEDIADIMFECLSYALAGHQSIVGDLKSRQFAWQRGTRILDYFTPL
jgi:hypothetical protein